MPRTSEGSAGEQPANAPSGESRAPPAGSLDGIFELLRPERRRNALYALYQRADAVAVADLAEAVASREDADPERVTAALYHVHLPKLAAAGVVDFDREEGRVRLADRSDDRFRRYLASAAADEGRPLRRAAASATLSEF